MADAPATDPQLTGVLPLYKQPELLDSQKHRNLGLSPSAKPYEFLRTAHFVPAIVGEFYAACANYPIIFTSERHFPVVVMGLREGENLFVDADGQIESHIYLPAYVRRYPFVAASNGMEQPAALCIDRAADVIQENPQQPFFDAEGQATELVRQAVDFVGRFQDDADATRKFVDTMAEMDMFEQKDVTISNQQGGGEPRKLAEYEGISFTKLQALPQEKIAEFLNNGYLGAIYAHLISLQRWEGIINRAALRGTPAPAASNGATAKPKA